MSNLSTVRNAAFFVAGGFAAALFLGGAAYAITDTVFKYSSAAGWPFHPSRRGLRAEEQHAGL